MKQTQKYECQSTKRHTYIHKYKQANIPDFQLCSPDSVSLVLLVRQQVHYTSGENNMVAINTFSRRNSNF